MYGKKILCNIKKKNLLEIKINKKNEENSNILWLYKTYED